MGRRIALDIARGLHFLHSKKIVHFDLKSANVLLSRDCTAKIADVGLAKIMHQQFLSTLYCVGTFAWAAPEVSSPPQLVHCVLLACTLVHYMLQSSSPVVVQTAWAYRACFYLAMYQLQSYTCAAITHITQRDSDTECYR